MTEPEIIVDTSALIAFLVSSETHHQTAKEYILNHPYQEWIILETVFNETVTWIRTRVSSQASVEVGEIL
ncbi:PIN domain-containing protein [Halothece sp. PCC 7418]|uniref:PIN domain-containing protein n=1 Tax=Halothece sp. (strain PCC 7418) TaxID=65093 RepID=UPI0002D9FF98|nr:PIN domain-containing protein [Halothece sp. PCC 7418]